MIINQGLVAHAGQVTTDLNINLSDSEFKKIQEHIKKYELEESLRKRYFKDIEIFENIKIKLIINNLPEDFAYIIMVESKFDPLCKSGKYRGLWQLNPYIGEKFGNLSSTDELYHPYKSTNASINYLLYLQKEFDDDHRLMLYAYNFGETRIKNLIKKYGKNIPKNKLPKVTQNYIPSMMAAKIVIDQWEREHNKTKE